MVLPVIKPKLNWKPDLPDFRDFFFSSLLDINRIPQHVDLRNFCSPIENQGQTSSCTAHAISGALEFLEDKFKEPHFARVSRLFVYYNERAYEGEQGKDGGGYIRDGIKSVGQYGAALEAIWPFDPARIDDKPSPEAYQDAASRKFTHYYRINSFHSQLKCLAEGFPFTVGLTLYESFMSNEVAATGMVPMPHPDEKLEGGHAVLVVGYDRVNKHVIIRNSWGTDWGDSGYFYLPFDYISNPDLADDMWTVRKNA